MFWKNLLALILATCVKVCIICFKILRKLCERYMDIDNVRMLEIKGSAELVSLLKMRSLKFPAKPNPTVVTRNIPSTYRYCHKCLLGEVENGTFDNYCLSKFVSKGRISLQHAKKLTSDNLTKLADQLLAALSVAMVAPFRRDELEIYKQGLDHTMPRMVYDMDMRKVGPLTSNPLVADMLRCSHMALYYSFIGEFNISDDLLCQAKQLAMSNGCSHEVVLMLYFIQYDLIARFEQTPTNDIQTEVINITLIGYGMLRFLTETGSQEYEEECYYSHFFLTKLVLCLLGIGNSCKVILDWTVTSDKIEKAWKYLLKLEDIQNYFVLRREMMYHLARGRYQELSQNYSLAECLITKAINCAAKGKFEESTIIKAYLDAVCEHCVHVRSDILEICSEDLSSVNSDDLFGLGLRNEPEGQSL